MAVDVEPLRIGAAAGRRKILEDFLDDCEFKAF
jgi:hypothetical protein